MPRPRKHAIFELGGQWIGREGKSPFFHRFWTEPGSGRTRRASLGTADIEAAKRTLAEIVIANAPKSKSSPLSVVLERYFEERSDALPSADNARLAGRTLLSFFGAAVRVEALTEARQREFAKVSAAKGHSFAYISRNLSVLSAAMNHSKLEYEFIRKDTLRKWGIKELPRKAFVPTDDQLAALLSLDLTEDFRRWLIVALLTGARPEAVLDLTPAARNREAGLLDLNPEGRAQNKKHRPIVREPRALTAWLDCWESRNGNDNDSDLGFHNDWCGDISDRGGSVVHYCAYGSVESVQSAIEGYRGGKNANTRNAVKLPRLSAYSARHKVATVLRSAGIPEDQIARQLGHKRDDVRVTAAYGEYAPDYLKPCADALDAWWIKLDAKVSGKSLFPPAAPASNVKELRRA